MITRNYMLTYWQRDLLFMEGEKLKISDKYYTDILSSRKRKPGNRRNDLYFFTPQKSALL